MPDHDNIPQHIAIIMDGNGRWARSRRLPRLKGHEAGIKTVKEIVRATVDLPVKVLTLYAFSQENWKRPKAEIFGLMGLLKMYLRKEIDLLLKNNVRLTTIGDFAGMPPDVRNILRWAMDETKMATGLTLNLALNYGARREIIEAVKKIIIEVNCGRIQPQDIDETLFSANLYTAGLPDPDLLIRTSGEVRLSNFLLWQCSYTEFYFTEKFWPDFTAEDLNAAVKEFQRRQRRFGGV